MPDELHLYSKEALMDMMKTAMGGRAAEQIFFNKVTTGAANDIEKITQIAWGIVMVYGMSEKFGLVNYSTGGEQY